MVVRRAETRDSLKIAELHIASWRATYTKELPPECLAAQDVAGRAAVWRHQLEQGVEVLLAEEGEKVVGFVAWGPARGPGSHESEAWEIYNLHVAPTRHGQGFGSALFERAAQLGRERGVADLVLWVVRTNAAARAFYERKGMEPEGSQQDHPVGPGHLLQEVRYRARVSAVTLG